MSRGVGYVFQRLEENGVLHWGRFVTNSRYRGLHIGTQLARRCFDDLFSQGYTQVYMEAREVTVKMIVNMGGEITGETVPFFLSPPARFS